MTSIAPRLYAYTVTAHRHGRPTPARYTFMATGPAAAITMAQELLPDHLISTALLHPDWHDEPA
jgi:hypothetical protein